MNTIANRRMETVRIIVLLCIVLALLALMALNVFYPLPIDFYSILLWFILGLALLFMGLRGLRRAEVRHEALPWYREPDALLSAGAFMAVALSSVLHYLSHDNVLTDVLLLVVFGVPTLILFAYSLRMEGASMPRRRNERSTM